MNMRDGQTSEGRTIASEISIAWPTGATGRKHMHHVWIKFKKPTRETCLPRPMVQHDREVR